MDEITIPGLTNSKNIANDFSNYRAFAANFEPLVIVKIGRDYIVYKADAESSEDYIYNTQSKDNIEGWLDGAVKAINKRFKALENKEVKEESKPILDNDELPEFCYTYIESEQKVGIIKKGVEGYYLADVDFSDIPEGDERKEACEKFVKQQNDLLEVTDEQKRAMEIKSMFGWRDVKREAKLDEEVVAEYETASTIANEIKRCLDEKLSDKVSTKVVTVDNGAGLLVRRKHDEDLVGLSDAIINQLNEIGIERDKYEIELKGNNLVIAIEEVQVPSNN